MASQLTILQLVGSPTNAFYCELSELYAGGCLAALGDEPGYHFVIAHVAPDGLWRFPTSLDVADIAAADALTIAQAAAYLDTLNISLALPQMFCPSGMTNYRALLDLLGIPFIGNDASAMALTADKAKARAIVAAAGVRVPDAEVLRKNETPKLALPLVIKPAIADNSDGITLAREAAQMPAALEAAFAFCDTVLAEQYIPLGREVRCGVIERAGKLHVLPLEEYCVSEADRPIRLPGHKLVRGQQEKLSLAAKEASEAWIVAASDTIVPAVAKAAKQCHRALDCRHYSLFDFRIDPAGNPWFLEAGLYCSFSPQSVLAMMAAADGIALPQFFAQCVAGALPPQRAAIFNTYRSPGVAST